MIKLKVFFIILVFLISKGFAFSLVDLNKSRDGKKFPVLKGPYLGQKPPGLTPELFAKGIISTELHDDAAPIFSPDGKEVYFRIVYKVEGRLYGTIFFMKQESGKWSYPEEAPFSGKLMDGGIKFSHDGYKLYLGSIRVGSDVSTTSGMDLWEIERIGGVWAEPKRLDGLNSENNEMNPCVSPDGKYLFFVSSRPNQNKNPQKKWDSPLFHGHEKIFGADIYWVSAKIIEQLKPKELKPKEGR